MPNTIEIKMTTPGFEVTIGGNTARFPHIDDAFAFARQRLKHAQQPLELSARCELPARWVTSTHRVELTRVINGLYGTRATSTPSDPSS